MTDGEMKKIEDTLFARLLTKILVIGIPGIAGLIVAIVGLVHAGPQGERGLAGEKGDRGPDGAPIGTIMPYAGELRDHGDCPLGWKLCNGDPVVGPNEKPDDYAEIIRLLSAAEWTKDSAGKPLLPDLRGMFLRGTGSNGNKEYHYEGDASTRVGRDQKHQIASHVHEMTGTTEYCLHKKLNDFDLAADPSRVGGGLVKAYAGETGGDAVDFAKKLGVPLGAHPEDETRPNNVAVMWIIKVR